MKIYQDLSEFDDDKEKVADVVDDIVTQMNQVYTTSDSKSSDAAETDIKKKLYSLLAPISGEEAPFLQLFQLQNYVFLHATIANIHMRRFKDEFRCMNADTGAARASSACTTKFYK